MPAKESGKIKKIPPTIIDIVVAFAVVAGILIAMFIYTGVWPPLVVVESRSMQHSNDESAVGIIDTGDLVLVKKVGGEFDIVTYLEGERENHRTYGDYGDVIIYMPGGSEARTPIIHRTIVFLEANDDMASYRIEELRFRQRGTDYDLLNSGDSWGNITGTVRLYNFSYQGGVVAVPVGGMIQDMQNRGVPLHDGHITKGDNNQQIDQLMNSLEPVDQDWIIGKARGELPWFGIIKLWVSGTLPHDTPSNSIRNLWITLSIIVAVPIAIEFFIWYGGRKGDEEAVDSLRDTLLLENLREESGAIVIEEGLEVDEELKSTPQETVSEESTDGEKDEKPADEDEATSG